MVKKEKSSCLTAGKGFSCCKVEAITSVDERGQMVLPKEIRNKAKIRPGEKIWPGPMKDFGKDLIRIDSNIRNNAGVGIDDRVEVHLSKAILAESLTLYPTEPLRIIGGERYLAQIMEGRVVSLGSAISINIMGRRLDLIVTQIIPKGDAGIVSADTRIQFTDKAPRVKSNIPKISYEDIGGLEREINKEIGICSFIFSLVNFPLEKRNNDSLNSKYYKHFFYGFQVC